jgi:hypothetical protein
VSEDSANSTHLVLLGRGEQPPPCKSPAERVTPTLRRLIEDLGPNPAFILGRHWDYLAWWERSSRVLVAKFRADSARHLGDGAVRGAEHCAAQDEP